MGSWEWTPATGAMSWSSEMHRIWGRPESDGPPSNHQFLDSIPEPDRTALTDLLRRTITEGGEPFRLEHRLTRADGRPTIVTGTSQDVTELKVALEAAQTSEERHRLAAAVTNDVLYDSRGRAGRAADRFDHRRNISPRVGFSSTAARRSRALVRQILTFSRKDDARRETVRVVPLIEATMRLVRATVPATISMDIDIEAESDTAVLGDPSLLQQSLLNLCVNAAHAMRGTPNPRLEITPRAVQLSEAEAALRGVTPGPFARRTVKNRGHGIPTDILDRVLEPFFTTKSVGEGTGLGPSSRAPSRALVIFRSPPRRPTTR